MPLFGSIETLQSHLRTLLETRIRITVGGHLAIIQLSILDIAHRLIITFPIH